MPLPDRETIARLSAPSLRTWMARVLFDWGCVALLFAILARWPHPIFFVVGVILLGSRQHAISFLGHDAAHFRICRNRWWNDLLGGIFASWPMAVGLGGYRKFHFLHHATLGTPADPELVQRAWASPQWDLPRSRWQVGLDILRDLTGMAASDIFCFARLMKPTNRWDLFGPVVWWSVALALLAWAGMLWIAGLWFFSLISAYWAVFRLRMWCEHIGTDSTHRVSARWWEKALYQPHNAWCHYEHHRWPSVPCWNLPVLRALETETPVLTTAELWRKLESSPVMANGAVPAQA